jgi:hypothetical protein
MIETNSTLLHNLKSYLDSAVPLNHLGDPTAFFVRAINRLFLTMEVFIMPAKAQKAGANNNGFTTKFVNFKLGKEDKIAFEQYMSQKADVLLEDLVVFISEGHKLSQSWDDKNKCFIASATCKDEGSINYDYCLTSRHPEWYPAVMMNVYKHKEMAAGSSWSDLTEEADWN